MALLPTLQEGTLNFIRFNGPNHLVSQYVIDFGSYSSAVFIPTGVDPQAVQKLPQQAAGVSIDNSSNNSYCVLQCGAYTENIPPYTKATVSIGINVTQVVLSGTSGVVSATFYTGSFPGTEIATNQLGANKGAILGVLPSGVMMMYGGLVGNVPDGWIYCGGQAISRVSYPDLFKAIGTLYGAGDGSSTFNVPECRGRFVRGFDNGAGVDSGRVLGSYQGATVGNHQHRIPLGSDGSFLYAWMGNSSYTAYGGETVNNAARVFQQGSNTSGAVSIAYTDANLISQSGDNRPVNVAVNYIIKA